MGEAFVIGLAKVFGGGALAKAFASVVATFLINVALGSTHYRDEAGEWRAVNGR